tara:strand:+ start:5819 stop:6658 length:840 start_codon:yes stop_codon:yes gene_type:complete
LSRRNNLERLGAPQPDAPAPPTSEATDLFSFVNPTEFVELPSKGLFYPEDHPLHNQTVIEIKHMTAKEEDILTSETLLKQGLAIDRLVRSVIADKSINPDTLLVGDKNAVLIASRITGFGPFYEVDIACPACAEQNEVTVNLSDLGFSESADSVSEATEGGYKVKLPSTGIEIVFKLLTSKDESNITKTVEARRKKKQLENFGTLLLSSIIVSANGVTNKQQLDRLAEILPLVDARFLREEYDKVKPDINMTFDFECSNCSHRGEVGMPMTAEFFWPRR